MLPKTYRYEISDRNDAFLGVLDRTTVLSPFQTTENINAAGAQLVITVGKTPDTAPLNVEAIQDETGNAILDETSDPILEERRPDVFGDSQPGILANEDNIVRVYEFSSFWPNGKLVYKGYISKVRANYGGDGNITLTCLTNGTDLTADITPGSVADSLDQSQTASDGEDGGDIGSWYTSTSPGDGQRYGQTFKVGAGVTNISAIVLKIATNYPSGTTPRTITLKLWNSLADATPSSGASPLGVVSMVLSDAVFAERTFRFASPITVVAGQTYFFSIDPDPASTFGDVSGWLGFACKTSNVYSNGTLCRRNSSSGGAYLTPFDYDMYFKTYYSHNTTEITYTDEDVSSQILDSLMDSYIGKGGLMQKQAGGYAASGVITTMSFKVNTFLEALQKVFNAGPPDWYWYGDMATEEIVYKAASTTADHVLVKGRHIQELDLESTKENIANVGYFSGGDDGTGLSQNIFAKLVSSLSLVNNRKGLVRLSDNRVKGTDGLSEAQLILQNYLDRHSEKEYSTQVKVLASTYDISLYKPGDMIGFQGFGNFIDSLLIQVASVQKTPDLATLTLGTPQKRNSKSIVDLERSLSDLQTIANPDTPS